MPHTSLPHPDDHFLHLALAQARMAGGKGEVPIGAVLVAADGHKVLGQGHNLNIATHDPSAHAEIQAMRQAAQALGNHRLDGCTLYVTLEPCSMCSGAMLHARLARVVFAVADEKTGAAGSVLNLFAHGQLNHHTRAELFQPQSGAGAQVQQQCRQLLQDFFRDKRIAQQLRRQQAQQAPLREDAVRLATPLPDTTQNSHWALLGDAGEAPWRMHFRAAGQGHGTVLLLHGYAAESRFWHDLPQRLAQQGWRVLAPDLLGHGFSDKPKKLSRHSLQWHHGLLEQWLQSRPMGQLHIVAHDSAAMLAVMLLQHNCQRQRRAVLINPAGLAWPATHPAKDWRTRCLRSPAFDLAQHWAMEGTPALDWQACYPDKGHRAALGWTTWAARGEPLAADQDTWQKMGLKAVAGAAAAGAPVTVADGVVTLTLSGARPEGPSTLIQCHWPPTPSSRDALRHNSGWLLSTLGRPD